MSKPIACPTCPVCDSPPLAVAANVVPWFCPNDDCLVFGWDPYSTRDENLLDDEAVRFEERDGGDDPPASKLH